MQFGIWNITSLTGKEVETIDKTEKYRIKILGVSETKKKEHGEKNLEKGNVLTSEMQWSRSEI